MARLQFLNMPDLSLFSDKGPIRLKFEGGAASVFEAMINDVMKAREGLSEAANEAAIAAADLKGRDGALHEAINRTTVMLNSTVDKISGTGNALENWRTTAADELSGLTGDMREKTRLIAEMVSMAGREIVQTLPPLKEARKSFEAAVGNTEEASRAFALNVEELTRRLAATTELMRTSGKVLSEATGGARIQMGEAVEGLRGGVRVMQESLSQIARQVGEQVHSAGLVSEMARSTRHTADQFQRALGDIERHNESLEKQIRRTGEQIGIAAEELLAARQTFVSTTKDAYDNNGAFEGLIDSLRHSEARLADQITLQAEEFQPLLDQWKEQGVALANEVAAQMSALTGKAQEALDRLTIAGEALTSRTGNSAENMERVAAMLAQKSREISEIAVGFDGRITVIGDNIERSAQSAFDGAREQFQGATAQMAMLQNGLGDVLQRLVVLGQLTGTLGAVAGQLGVLIASAPDHMDGEMNQDMIAKAG